MQSRQKQKANPKDPSSPLTVTLPLSLKKKVVKEAKRHQVTVSAYVSQCLRDCAGRLAWPGEPK